MRLSQHVKYTTVASVVLVPFCNLQQILWFAVGSILIDFDHYIFYVVSFKKFSVKGMFKYFERLFSVRDRVPYGGLNIFHTIDFFVLMGVASYYLPFLFYVLMGLIYHFILDVIYLSKYRHTFSRAYFIIEHFVRVRKHKRNGYPYLV